MQIWLITSGSSMSRSSTHSAAKIALERVSASSPWVRAAVIAKLGIGAVEGKWVGSKMIGMFRNLAQRFSSIIR